MILPPFSLDILRPLLISYAWRLHKAARRIGALRPIVLTLRSEIELRVERTV
jgi:hypothetical protein